MNILKFTDVGLIFKFLENIKLCIRIYVTWILVRGRSREVLEVSYNKELLSKKIEKAEF